MDGPAIDRSLMRISHEIVEKNAPCENLCVIGVYRRGVPLAKLIAGNVGRISGITPHLGELDISLYRDDLTEKSEQATVGNTRIDFDLKGKVVVLVDDVLYTGRTTRAAIEAIIRQGRPAAIQLAVLVDRGR